MAKFIRVKTVSGQSDSLMQERDYYVNVDQIDVHVIISFLHQAITLTWDRFNADKFGHCAFSSFIKRAPNLERRQGLLLEKHVLSRAKYFPLGQ